MTDHYQPDMMNAHFDTKPFIERLMQELTERGAPSARDDRGTFRAEKRADCYRYLYDAVEAGASTELNEPDDDALLCRYLSPEKFLWFLAEPRVHLSRPDTFDDHAECALHDDFNTAIQQDLNALVEAACGPTPPSEWDDVIWWREWESYERARRNDWLISCWTWITEHYDDKLLSFKYTGGRFGVGITVHYGDLRALMNGLAPIDRDKKLWCGHVNYDPRMRKILPFNKRPGFRGEREVRFALRPGAAFTHVSTPVSDLKKFGLRLSTDSPPHHRGAIQDLWREAGGSIHNIHET